MSTNDQTLFEAFLNQHDSRSWENVIASLLPSIHEVDKNATQIWFYFFPLDLARAFEAAADPEQLAYRLEMLGNYRLSDQIDSSHAFVYGHRYWPQVKAAVAEHASSTIAPSSLELAAQIREVASVVARKTGVDQSLLVGITAIAFMTLQQVGLSAFKAAPGHVVIDKKHAGKTPEQVLKARAKDDSQGPLGFLRGAHKIWTVTFDENDEAAKFKLINTQELATAAANDKREYHLRDPRCKQDEGPIPVQCRAAACGTCWVGVLGGAEKLSSVGSLEYRRIREFGYIETEEDKPLIRLACMAQATGAVSIVIPPWNGVFGKFIRSQRESDESAHSVRG